MNNHGLGYVGQAGRIITVLIQGTDGKGLTGLTYSTVTCYASKIAAASSVRALVTMTGATWVSLGFNEIDATHMPGLYRFGVPNADQDTVGEVVYVFSGTGIGLATYSLLISAANSLAAPIDGSLLATTADLDSSVTSLAASISTVNSHVTAPLSSTTTAIAQEVLVTLNGKRGNKLTVDKTGLTSKVTDIDGTTVISNEPIVLDSDGNIIALG